MILNFNEEEAIIILDNGIELRICEEQAKEIAREILNYFED